jgi:hypothetical protein
MYKLKKVFCLLSIQFIAQSFCYAQFAPQANLAGSTAIYKDSSVFVDWGKDATVHFGWLNIADTTLGRVPVLNSQAIYNKADGSILSLGDGGEIIYYFSNAIINETGFDFAIFENGFANPADSNEAFLELAKVSVSENGIDFFEFKATCNNDTITQIAGFGVYTDCRNLNNLAGKYILNYGTPFDLDELKNENGLDVMNIHFVKMKDVVGSLNENGCTRDFYNHKINDPYPTPFASAGFDIDALGVIHQKYPTSVENSISVSSISLYPNPCRNELNISSKKTFKEAWVKTFDGRLMAKLKISNNKIDIRALSSTLYFLELIDSDNHVFVSKFIKQ